ncbi:hypothetical protein GCM10011519_08360 [Marmoricola endophyticus]|uniref:Bacterial bifunctional deaminase-reductase C-terminal domain-containing protein n=1 Tax=Marmoricola endophyticus TaxID=2040280 RepID=A0A917BD54_9ACTN|nr:dihydrofolate reductase family protein [Marmoricola endophyticus]GGF37179.1 hypothetical protein GCM10011519_08360 [Marmoricola endophyticus]
MGRLVYAVIASLDGYLADEAGRFDWAEPDEEVLALVNDQEERIGTYLYGRRAYEMMTVWEHDPGSVAADSPQSGRFARIWQQASKIVYSTTLDAVSTRDTTLRRVFDVDEVRTLVRDSEADVNVFGPTLAAHAFAAGLVEEVQVTVVPHLVGGGLAWFPGGSTALERREVRQLGAGAVWLRYAVGERRA